MNVRLLANLHAKLLAQLVTRAANTNNHSINIMSSDLVAAYSLLIRIKELFGAKNIGFFILGGNKT